MFEWVKGLFKRKVDTSPAIESEYEPTLADVLDSLFIAREAEIRAQVAATDSVPLQVKLKARADEVAFLRTRVKELSK